MNDHHPAFKPGQPVKGNKKMYLEYYEQDCHHNWGGSRPTQYSKPGVFTINIHIDQKEYKGFKDDKEISDLIKSMKSIRYEFGDYYRHTDLYPTKKTSNSKILHGFIMCVNSEKDDNYKVTFETELGKVTTTLHAGHIECDREGHRDRQIKQIV